MNHTIYFEKANYQNEAIIFSWLAEPHMQEFWDNSQEHKDDIVNFIYDRKQYYFNGTTKYWIGFIDNQPYCFILTDEIHSSESDLSEIHRKYLSVNGRTIGIDFGIGNKNFLGKGLASPTLEQFTEFYQKEIDPRADTFFIDPNDNNPRAKHVYEKAGFKLVGDFEVTKGAFVGKQSLLLVKQLKRGIL